MGKQQKKRRRKEFKEIITKKKAKQRQDFLEAEALWQDQHNRALEALYTYSKPKKPRTKKLPYEDHEKYFRDSLRGHSPIRPPCEWKPKTYNVFRQRVAYLQWVLCKYPVPVFLLNTLITEVDTRQRFRKVFQDWAIAVGSGQSLYKVAKEILTKKECHYFLNFTDRSAEENVWRARCTRNGVHQKFITSIVETLVRRSVFIRDLQWIEFIEFVGKNQAEFESTALMEIMDFLTTQFDQVRTLKGRTVSSLTRMSNEWHQATGRTKFKGAYVTWLGSGINPWHIQFKADSTVWSIVEILDSKDLYTEGNKLRHCVGSYTGMCVQGSTHIFSLRKKTHKDANQFLRCVTIEVQHNTIYQARRRMNNPPTAEESTIIRRWARDNNIGASEKFFQRY